MANPARCPTIHADFYGQSAKNQCLPDKKRLIFYFFVRQWLVLLSICPCSATGLSKILIFFLADQGEMAESDRDMKHKSYSTLAALIVFSVLVTLLGDFAQAARRPTTPTTVGGSGPVVSPV